MFVVAVIVLKHKKNSQQQSNPKGGQGIRGPGRNFCDTDIIGVIVSVAHTCLYNVNDFVLSDLIVLARKSGALGNLVAASIATVVRHFLDFRVLVKSSDVVPCSAPVERRFGLYVTRLFHPVPERLQNDVYKYK